MKKKKIIIAAGIVAVVAIGAFFLLNGKKQPVAAAVQCTPLAKSSISNTISTSGTVESTDSVDVYTDLNYIVQTIPVKVGDHVTAGQTLCILDSKDLNDSIAQKQATMSTTAKQTAQKIKASQKKYNDAKSTLSAGLNSQINDAADKVTTAKRDLETAQQKLSDEQKHLADNTNSNLISAKNAVDSAQITLDSATKTYNDYKKQTKDLVDDETKAQLHQYYTQIESAQLALDTAKKNLNAANTASNEELSTYTKAVTTAQINYDSAVKAQKTILSSVNQDLVTAFDNVTSDRLSADQSAEITELEALQTKLAKCNVTAPSAGTVTAVYAVKNSPASGLLFVIEDTNALKMVVKIKEYDVANTKIGMKATVKADAISDKTFDGVLEKVAPTSLKDKTGATASSTDAEYESDILITSKDARLLIGMNGTANIILEKKDSVYVVPFDAVTTDASGKSIVYTATAQKDGTFKATPIPVTTGIETDSDVEISGSGLKDGIKIISDGKQIISGAIVKIAAAESEGAAKSAGAAE